MDTVLFIDMWKSRDESVADVDISIVQITGRFQQHGKKTCKAKWSDFFKSCGFINYSSSFRGTHMWPIIRDNYMLFNMRPFHAFHYLPLFIVFNKRILVYFRWLYYLHQLVLFVYTLTKPSSYILNVRGFECSNLPYNTGDGQKRVAQTSYGQPAFRKCGH
jgi:hypothetical protein